MEIEIISERRVQAEMFASRLQDICVFTSPSLSCEYYLSVSTIFEWSNGYTVDKRLKR